MDFLAGTPKASKPAATAAEKEKTFLEAAQEALIRRFSRPARTPEPVVFEFTNDKAMLHQYYRLRDQTFGRDFFNSDGSGGADALDKISEILVARRGKLLIGACRLTVRDGDESFLLPMENDEFKIREAFPNLPLNQVRHAAISKFAILEEHRQNEMMYGLCNLMFERVVALDIHYVFVRTTAVLARNWRMIANSFGAKNTRICNEINVPMIPNFEERPYLVMSDISELCQQKFPRIYAPKERKIELVAD
ncbi:MAG: GNAT family N-acyltransferase [Alphaproteobacteria bacterium]|nr:GNAT family N-acyltransferase [Alphaproteobacteria bacterium]